MDNGKDVEGPSSRQRRGVEALNVESQRKHRQQRLWEELVDLQMEEFQPLREGAHDVDNIVNRDYGYNCGIAGGDGDIGDDIDDNNDINGDSNFKEEEEEDDKDLLDNAKKDYQCMKALDTYGCEGIGAWDYDSMYTDTVKFGAWRAL